MRVEEDDSGIDITIAFGNEERFDVPIASIKQDLYTRLGARPDAIVRIRIDQPPVRRVLARVTDVPGFGYKALEPATLAHPVTVDGRPAEGPLIMANGLVTVTVDRHDGTFAIDGVAGFGKLVDGGDHGDSYNYSPPAGDRIVDAPDTVTVSVTDRGPVRAVATVLSRYTWPDHVDGFTRARTGEVPVDVTTEIERARRRARREGDHPLRQPGLRPPAAGASPPARTGRRAPTPSAPSPSCTGASTPRAGPTNSDSRPSRPGASCPPVASPSPTRACSSTSWWTSRGSSPIAGPGRWHSRCCARRGCCRASAWPIAPCRRGPSPPSRACS